MVRIDTTDVTSNVREIMVTLASIRFRSSDYRHFFIRPVRVQPRTPSGSHTHMLETEAFGLLSDITAKLKVES